MVVEAPLAVKIVVYDLLPPSRLAAFLNLLGSGVYHSSVSIAIPLGPTDSNPTPKEYAFGGHYQPGVSGIFAVPEGTAASRMPGLKYYLTLDVGEAFGEDWRRVFGPKLRRRSLSRVNSVERSESSTSPDRVVNARGTGGEQGPVPYGGGWTPTASTTRLTVGDGATDAGEDPFKDPEPVDEDARLEDDGGEKDGTQYMTKLQRRAWRIIEQMKKEEEWNGTKYSLLSRNCNTFTDELVWRLTGRRAPGYLNRAAWFATSAPCLIPAGWIDEPELENDTPTSSASRANVVVLPPRADQMSVSGRV